MFVEIQGSRSRAFLVVVACALAADLLYLQYGGLSAAAATRLGNLTQLAMAGCPDIPISTSATAS